MSEFDFPLYKGGNNSKKEHHQCCNNLISSLYFLLQKWTGQHKPIARISAIRTMHRLGQVSFNTALFMVRPTEILLTVYRLSAGNTSNNRSHINNGTFNPLKTKRRPLYLKTQSVPRCKHFISVIKTNQFMLQVAQVAVCSEINTKLVQCGQCVQLLNVNFLRTNL